MSILKVNTIQKKDGTQFPLVGQVVTATNSSEQSTTSTSFTASTLSASITPTSTSSKVIVLISTSSGNNSSSSHCYTTIYRDSTNLGGSNGFNTTYQDGTGQIYGSTHLSITDSPSTTGSVTYTLYYRASANTAKINASGITGTITLMEVLA